jgi:hypothetical protein
MISYEDVRQLQQYPSTPDSRVLSLYVDTDQSKSSNLNRGFRTVVENEFRRMADSQDSNNGKSRLLAECQRILEFLKDYKPKGRSLVLFSDSSSGFWWQRDLQVELPHAARWSPRPWTRPLLEVIEGNDAFAVVLIDKPHARILTIDASGMQQHAEITSEVPNKHAMTGTDHIMSQSQMERDHTNHIKLHVKRVSEELAGLVDRLKLSRIVIGGPVEATSMFASELPKRLQQMTVGLISVPVDATHERLIREIKEVQQTAESKDEAKLVESMVTSAMKGDRAVLGISKTLDAIEQGRVYCLVVSRDYHVEGEQCASCGILLAEAGDTCSFCGGTMEAAPDLINRASHKVMEQSGRVQVVSGDAAGKLGDAGVGAVLRF